MAQLETLEAKMANIEVSLSATSRRKKGGSISSGMISPANLQHQDYCKELDSLRIALRDKENVIQTLKDQLYNTLSNRLGLRNGTTPLTEQDRKVTEERLERLKRDADNKKLAIKNLKLALKHLDITDNIDVRIQQAELEYRLGREELELLTLREKSRTLQTALELAETQEKKKNDTIFNCIIGSTQMTAHALEVSADPNSPRFGAGPRENAFGLYVDWAIQDSGLCIGDRILEVNGKLVVGADRSDLARLLAVAPDAAQVVVLRKSESMTTLPTLRSDNLRLTHRISYLEEQVRDLLAPRTEIAITAPAATKQNQVQVFQKGPQVTTLVSPLPTFLNTRQTISNMKKSKRSSNQHDTIDYLSTDTPLQSRSSISQHKLQHQCLIQLTKSTTNLNHIQQDHHQLHYSSTPSSSHRHALKTDEQMHDDKNRNHQQQFQFFDIDSKSTYYKVQDYTGSGIKNRPEPPKKPLRLSLHRATSLQSVESAPPTILMSLSSSHHQDSYIPSQKSMKRSHRENQPTMFDKPNYLREIDQTLIAQEIAQPSSRTRSRAESCQSALKWPFPKSRLHLPHISMEKWC